jgi:hypothetical protein
MAFRTPGETIERTELDSNGLLVTDFEEVEYHKTKSVSIFLYGSGETIYKGR